MSIPVLLVRTTQDIEITVINELKAHMNRLPEPQQSQTQNGKMIQKDVIRGNELGVI